jgi:DNA-binding transcriptional regulator YiaG
VKTLRERGIPTKVSMPVGIPTPDGKGIAETVMVEVDALKDPTDGEIYLNGETLERLDKIKARRMGVLLPTEIRELRRQLDLTQKEMSNVLGIGEKTYTRWEIGKERPSQSLNKMLVALWEGRLNLASLRAMRQPVFSWDSLVKDSCPCGTEHKPQLIAVTHPEEEISDEICGAAA